MILGRLEVGETYGTLGGGDNYDEVTIVSVDEEAGRYQTKGTRQVANVILFGCEQHWRRVPTLPGDGAAAEGADASGSRARPRGATHSAGTTRPGLA